MTDTSAENRPSVQVLEPHEVPLGGDDGLVVRRLLPSRHRSFVGAWCFSDHYGPIQVGLDGKGGMDVAPHPHTGLQTVSWLVDGEIEHRDSNGVVAMVLPGEMNLMTSGAGIAHSEQSTSEVSLLRGVQLWIALPREHRDAPRDFQHYVPDEVALANGGASALVFVGELPGVDTADVETFTPLLGAEIRMERGITLELDVDPGFEHGVLVDAGYVELEGTELQRGQMGCLNPGLSKLTIRSVDRAARVFLLGGEPFEEEIVMWWNFIGHSHEEVAQAREDWEAQSDRFGRVEGYVGEHDRIPAPPLPATRLVPRGRFGRRDQQPTSGQAEDSRKR